MTSEDDNSGAHIPLPRSAVDEWQLKEAHLKRAVEHELHVAFPAVPTDQVAILVECLWSQFDTAPVRDFVPLLVRKQANEELLDHLGLQGETVLRSSEALPTAQPWLVSLRLEDWAP